jgi:CDP-glycerol glycerophosphotransferase
MLLAAGKILLNLPLNMLYLLANFFPKDDSLWIFSAWGGKKYSDNPRYLYEYILLNHKKINPVWISKDKILYTELKSKGVPAVYAYSTGGFFTQLRAAVAVFTHSVDWDFLSPLIARQTLRVQAWHGIPIKKIGFDDIRHTKKLFFRNEFFKRLLPFKVDFYYDLVLAVSSYDKEIYKTAFKIHEDNISITGYPRNDAILNSKNDLNGINVIYLPTYRGAVGSEFKLLIDYGFDYEKYDSILKRYDCKFFIKLHPVQKISSKDLEKIKLSENIKFIENDVDLNDLLGNFSILISDYSGAILDYLITGRPFILAPFDHKNYLKEDRDLYIKYDELCCESACNSWDEVFSSLSKILDGGCISSPKIEGLATRFHMHRDNRSAERAYIEIIKKLHERKIFL